MTDLIKQLNDLVDLLTRQKAELDQALKGLDAQDANEPDESMIEDLNAVDEMVDELDDLSYTLAETAEALESLIDELKGD